MNNGLCGITNIGNSCYFASALQLLSNCSTLRNYILENKYKLNYFKTESLFFKEIINFINHIWKENNKIYDPSKLKSVLASFKDQYNNTDQNDSSEVLIDILELLHNSSCFKVNIQIHGIPKTKEDYMQIESIKSLKNYYENEYSYITKEFYGQLHISTECINCSYTVNNYDPYTYLPLSLNKADENDNIYDLLDTFTNNENMDNDNKWKCEKCKQETIIKRKINLWKLPKVLIIVLKRLENPIMKNTKNIIYFTDLDLRDYCGNYSKDNSYYDLIGVSIHEQHGSFQHYYSYCKHPDNAIWYEYNDSSVTEIKDEEDIISSDAYILVYERK